MDKDVEQGNGQGLDKDGTRKWTRTGQGRNQEMDKDWTRTLNKEMDKDGTRKWTRTGQGLDKGNGQGLDKDGTRKWTIIGRDEDMVWPLALDVGEGWGDGERDREGGVLYSKRRRVSEGRAS